ncbi:hypothetical protein BCR42DRAFT_402129 [Absidia repens]|uniref:SWIRM domain-domain-containing protein n=1 Tax=Absidia repens TaxID=90262 RepID=A0A1X2IXQ3_9FUNG|nr:hypothetical protein BCR42DRAFT_402129 [Absidia repens]
MVASPSAEPMVDFEYYDKQETIDKFNAILPYFRRDLATSHNVTVKSTAAQLASFTASFKHFQYTVLGTPSVVQTARFSSATSAKKTKNTTQQASLDNNNNGNDNNNNNKNDDDDDENNAETISNTISRTTTSTTSNNKAYPPCLPSSMFNADQLDPTSPLYIILKTAYAHQPDEDLWHLDSPRKRSEYLELTHTMFERLEEAGLYQPPRIALMGLSKGDDEKRLEMISMIHDLKGKVVNNVSQATHLVHFQKKDEKDDAKRVVSRMVHILESDQGNVLVHWYRYPDSYNEWMNEKKIKDNKRFDGASEQQEETANTTTAGATATDDHGSGDADGSLFYLQSSWLTDSYKFNTWMPTQDYLCSPSTLAGLKRSLETASGGGDELLSSDEGGNKRHRKTNDDEDEGDDDTEKTALDRQEQARRHLTEQSFEVIIPSYAAWFEFDRIHKTERRSLPEFFNDANQTKSPVAYLDMRNFMVNTYRLNPLEYLTVTACRRNMTGDVCAMIRIHGFLEKWGLINYQIDPTLKMSNIGPPFAGSFKMVMDMPESQRPSRPLVQNNSSSSITSSSSPSTTAATGQLKFGEEGTSATSNTNKDSGAKKVQRVNLNLELRQSIYKLPSKRSSSGQNGITNHTSAPSSLPSLSSSLSGTVQNGTDVVGKTGDDTDKKELTDQQKVLLMEGLEMFGHDWNLVAQHAGLSRDDCILHYLHLPLEDPYVDLDIIQMGLDYFSKSQQHKRQQDHNPLFSVMTFLEANADRDAVVTATTTTTPATATVPPCTKDDSNTSAQHDLIRTKVMSFKNKLEQYLEHEGLIEQERQALEQERHQLAVDQSKIQTKATKLAHEISTRSTHVSNEIVHPTVATMATTESATVAAQAAQAVQAAQAAQAMSDQFRQASIPLTPSFSSPLTAMPPTTSTTATTTQLESLSSSSPLDPKAIIDSTNTAP